MRRSRVRLLYPAPTSDPPQAEKLPAGPSSSVTVGQKAELSRLAQSAAMSAFCKNHIVRRWGLFESSSHADLTSTRRPHPHGVQGRSAVAASNSWNANAVIRLTFGGCRKSAAVAFAAHNRNTTSRTTLSYTRIRSRRRSTWDHESSRNALESIRGAGGMFREDIPQFRAALSCIRNRHAWSASRSAFRNDAGCFASPQRALD